MQQAVSSFTFHPDLQESYRVLDMEIRGLQELKHQLGNNLIQAADLLASAQGRVVVTGVGKSGHIGRKMASTFASTGTPSFFIHPVEASHGDLGMLMKGDVLIALSNSGETKELAEIVAFSKANHISLIAVTKNPHSALATTADLCLLLPDVPEACPLELAPTTSSLATLALGDALAMVLLKRRGFTPCDFGRLHPGGKLGSKLIKLDQIMHKGQALPLVTLDTLVKDVLLEMTSKSFGCAGVVDEQGCLKGIITDGDLRRHMGPTLLDKKARDIMSVAPKTLSPDTLVEEATAFMNEKSITCVFILDSSCKPLGFVRMHDCIKNERLL